MTRRFNKRVALVAAVLVAVAVMSSMLAARSRSDPDGPSGILALRRLLTGMGATVQDGADPPASGTFVVDADLRTPEQAEELLDWVRSGGRLVVGDMTSAVVPMVQMAEDLHSGGVVSGCAAAEAAGVRRVATSDTTSGVIAEGPTPIICFGPETGAFGARSLGRGRVVVVPDLALFTNEYLRQQDNARLAVQTFGTGTVVFGGPLPSGALLEGRGVWASLPPVAKAIVLQIVVAFLIYALLRARRLGKPVDEETIAPIPAGELVRATAELYRSAKQPAHAATLMRRAMRTRLERRGGHQIADAVEGPPPGSDAELVAAARSLENLRREVEGADR